FEPSPDRIAEVLPEIDALGIPPALAAKRVVDDIRDELLNVVLVDDHSVRRKRPRSGTSKSLHAFVEVISVLRVEGPYPGSVGNEGFFPTAIASLLYLRHLCDGNKRGLTVLATPGIVSGSAGSKLTKAQLAADRARRLSDTGSLHCDGIALRELPQQRE